MTLPRARVPANGLWRACLWGAALAVAAPGAAQRIAYPPVARGEAVLPGPPRLPRIAYPRLAVDPRIAPGDFAPETEDASLAQLSQNYRPRPALWRIRDRDTTIHLFGTIHVLPPGFRWRSAAVERPIAASDALIVESIDDAAALPRAVPRVALAARVSRHHRAAFARFAASLPPDALQQLDGMPTWMAAVAIDYVRDVQVGEVPGPGADDWLERRFHAQGKPVVPIEDGGRVLARIGTITEPTQRHMLDAALDAEQAPRAVLRAPLHAWARGEVGPGSPLTIDLDRETGSDALNAPLLIERNRAWVRALIARLRVPGTAFFAAGAGHFVGAGSVLVRLERRGIHVERID